MTNAFGIDDPRISKGDTSTGMRMAAAGMKGLKRSALTGGNRKTGELSRRLAAAKKQPSAMHSSMGMPRKDASE